MNQKQKFSDRFLPRKVSKHEKRARAIHVKILEDFNEYLKDCESENIWFNWICFSDENKYEYYKKYGNISNRIFDVIRKQVDQTKPLEK